MIVIIAALFVILLVLKIIDAVTRPLCSVACPALRWRHQRPRTGDLIFFHMPRQGVDLAAEFVIDSFTSQPVGHTAMVVCLGGERGDAESAQIYVLSAGFNKPWRLDPLRAFAKFTSGAILMALHPPLRAFEVIRAMNTHGAKVSVMGVVHSLLQGHLKLREPLSRSNEVCSSMYISVLEELGVATRKKTRGSVLPNELMLAHDPERSPLQMMAPYRFSPPVLLDTELNIVCQS